MAIIANTKKTPRLLEQVLLTLANLSAGPFKEFMEIVGFRENSVSILLSETKDLGLTTTSKAITSLFMTTIMNLIPQIR